MFLTIAGIAFAIFVANVVLGAADSTMFLNDVGEMIVLFIASIFFVVAILKRESERDANGDAEVS